MRRQGWHSRGLALALFELFACAAFAAEPVPAAVGDGGVWPIGAVQPLPPVGQHDVTDDQLRELSQRLSRAEAGVAELRAQQAATRPQPRAGDGGDPASDELGAAGSARLVSMQQEQGQGQGQSQGRPLERGVEDRIRSIIASLKPSATYPLVRLSGFTQIDNDNYSQDAASLHQIGDVQNGTAIRRARLQAIGKATEYTNFSIEMEFASAGRPSFYDVWGEQMNLPTGTVRVGQYRQPVSMDSWTSARHLEFLERSAPFQAFDPFRRVGIMNWWISEDQHTLVAASLYCSGGTYWNGTATQYSEIGDDRYGTQLGDNGGVGFATRATRLLYYDDSTDGRSLLHIGGGYDFSEIAGNGAGAAGTLGGGTWRTTVQPESFMGDAGGSGSTFAGTPNVLDTGRILAHNLSLLHAELAGNYGSAHFQAEYFGQWVNQYAGPALFYDGAYAQCGYFLTGETAGYNKQTGAMDYNVKPYNEFIGLGPGRGMVGLGAWEVATRWSYVDLQNSRVNPANYQNVTSLTASNGGAGPGTAFPNPGVLNSATAALNWWWNQYTRVEFNYIVTMLDSQYHGFSRMETYGTRFQVEF